MTLHQTIKAVLTNVNVDRELNSVFVMHPDFNENLLLAQCIYIYPRSHDRDVTPPP